MGKFTAGFVLEAQLTLPPSGTCRGIMGMGVDCTGRTLATGFSSTFRVGCLGEKDKRPQRGQHNGHPSLPVMLVEPLQTAPLSSLGCCSKEHQRTIQGMTNSKDGGDTGLRLCRDREAVRVMPLGV